MSLVTPDEFRVSAQAMLPSGVLAWVLAKQDQMKVAERKKTIRLGHANSVDFFSLKIRSGTCT